MPMITQLQSPPPLVSLCSPSSGDATHERGQSEVVLLTLASQAFTLRRIIPLDFQDLSSSGHEQRIPWSA